MSQMMNRYHDWAGVAVVAGDVVLDGRGMLWRVEEFAYGPENFALGYGLTYNRSAGERMVELGLTFKIAGPIVEELAARPMNQQEGRERYQELFDALCARSTQNELRERKREFQKHLR